jgi:ABC-type ATPase involved in cell division
MTQYRRTHVGFVFQFYNLIPSLTARENVALVTETHNAVIAAIADRVVYFGNGMVVRIERNEYKKTAGELHW